MFAVPEKRLTKLIVMDFDVILAQSLAATSESWLKEAEQEGLQRILTNGVCLLLAVFHLTLLSIW
jgi:hypothetical protein